MADAEVVITNQVRLGKENLADARCLRLICVAATGYDNVDVDYARSRGRVFDQRFIFSACLKNVSLFNFKFILCVPPDKAIIKSITGSGES